MTIGKELINRLICAKYLFHIGIGILDQGGPFSPGRAVLHFQDSAEMLLRVIAEHLHCSVKENASFNQIIDSIDNKSDKNLTHRSALNQLNKARVSFKHFGLEPKLEDVSKFRNDLESFFPTATKTFLNIDFELISLTNLIGHRRTENFLNRAEQLIYDGDYEGSISSTAIAFTVFRSHLSTEDRVYMRDPFRRLKIEDSKIGNWIDEIEEIVTENQVKLNLIADGISISDYRIFQRYAPNVNLSEAGTYEVICPAFGQPIEPTQEIALFCHRFAIDSILIMKANQLPPRFPTIEEAKRKLRVTKKCPIIVWPCEDPEIIRYAEEGEILVGRAERFDKSDYIAIVQDGDDAYIKEDGVSSVD